MKKTLATLALAGGIGLLGAGWYISKKQTEQQQKPVKKYEFTEYGEIKRLTKEKVVNYNKVTQIEVADLDNDGDFDIVVGDDVGNLYLFENKIPQKNK